MNWRQLLSQARNEGINSGGRGLLGPIINEYNIEGETAKEFYQRERERKLNLNTNMEVEISTSATTGMLAE